MGKHSYGVILDAGSSGSRVYVYRWQKPEHVRAKGDADDLRKLPEIKTKKEWRKKVHPGVSTFGDRPEEVGSAHLAPLLDFALGIVPKDEVANTPIFLLATAGVRLLPQDQRSILLTSICSFFRTYSRFQLPDCNLHVQVIPGETEGLYGWIAANYLLGGFDAPEKHDHGKGHHTYGFLDMGGASAQIAFAPNATETAKHAKDLKLLRLRSVNGTALEHKVFVTTWLRFGVNEARRRYIDHLCESYPTGRELPDPCLPTGLQLNKTGHELPPALSNNAVETRLVGTGQFAECLKRTYPLLEKDRPCSDPPCLLNGVHTPAIDFDVNHFVGVSEYWHTTHELFAMAHKDKAYDLHSYQKQVTELCSRRWSEIKVDVDKHKWGDKVDEKTLEDVCFKASWLINVLHDGIGIPRIGIEHVKEPNGGPANKTKAVLENAKDRGFLDPFQAVDKIDGTEVSWTLGKMVLYASSQVPAASDAEAVGFGSNKPGVVVPPDFQYPSISNASIIRPASAPGGSLIDADDGDDWHDRILSGSYSRRVPGILIFLLILALAVYLICGRERRTNIYHKLIPNRPSNPRRPGLAKRRKGPAFLSSKLFGQSGPAYERVTTDPDTASLTDVELGDVAGTSPDEAATYSDSSNNSNNTSSPPRTGRASGLATPATRGLSPDFSRSSPKTKGYFERAGAAPTAGSAAAAAGHGLGITAVERSGWLVRTESRERLAPRSRATSPNRKSPLMTPFKENMD